MKQTGRPASVFSPLHPVPQNKTRVDPVLPEFYNRELWLSNNSDSTIRNLRDVRQTTKKIQQNYPKNCAQDGSTEKNQTRWSIWHKRTNKLRTKPVKIAP